MSAGAMPPAAPDALLACRPDRDGDTLVFPYAVTNRGAVDLYVMDALPGIDPDTLEPRADTLGVTVALAGDRFAHVLRGLAPLPKDRVPAIRVMPLAVRLAPGAKLERRLLLPLPLIESSPYHPDLPVRQYDVVEIAGVCLAIDTLPATAEGFAAAVCDYARDHRHVTAHRMAAQMQRVSLRIPARQLSILRRRDAFPRPE